MHYKNVFTSTEDTKTLREAGKISAKILKELKESTKAGIKAADINNLALKLCEEHKVKPSFKGVPGLKSNFPSALCVSVNDEVLHGIPYESKIFKEGDVIKLDFGIIYKGFYTDHCITVGLQPLSLEITKLINTAKLCIDTAVKEAIIGNTVGDISYTLQNIADLGGFDFVTTYCGHGIGKSLHESPEVLSYGQRGMGAKLIDGMVLCIENQLTTGNADLKVDPDGWTLRTRDGSIGAMFEHMVIVRKDKPEILTLID